MSFTNTFFVSLILFWQQSLTAPLHKCPNNTVNHKRSLSLLSDTWAAIAPRSPAGLMELFENGEYKGNKCVDYDHLVEGSATYIRRDGCIYSRETKVFNQSLTAKATNLHTLNQYSGGRSSLRYYKLMCETRIGRKTNTQHKEDESKCSPLYRVIDVTLTEHSCGVTESRQIMWPAIG